MSQSALTNIQHHEIETEMEKISSRLECLNPDFYSDYLEICRLEESLDFYIMTLEKAYSRAKIQESTLRLAV